MRNYYFSKIMFVEREMRVFYDDMLNQALQRSKAPSGKFSKFSYKISESIKFSKFFLLVTCGNNDWYTNTIFSHILLKAT